MVLLARKHSQVEMADDRDILYYLRFAELLIGMLSRMDGLTADVQTDDAQLDQETKQSISVAIASLHRWRLTVGVHHDVFQIDETDGKTDPNH